MVGVIKIKIKIKTQVFLPSFKEGLTFKRNPSCKSATEDLLSPKEQCPEPPMQEKPVEERSRKRVPSEEIPPLILEDHELLKEVHVEDDIKKPKDPKVVVQ